MIVELRCDKARPRAWIAAAVKAMAVDHHTVGVRWIDTGAPIPDGLDLLFKLESMVLNGGRPSGIDSIDRRHVAPPNADDPDIVIDFTDVPREQTDAARTYLRPLYNGLAGEDAALTAILAGDLPVIELRDDIQGRVIDRGHPSSEIAAGLGGSLETVMHRTVTLLKANLSGQARATSSIPQLDNRRAIGTARGYVIRGLSIAVLKRLYRLCCYAPHWHVGWRFTEGAGVWQTHDLSGNGWRRLPERAHHFCADPFPITWQGRTFVFFEELDHRVGKGIISAIEFDDAGPIGAIVPILEEPWHLSYPFLIEDGGQLWMIPESSAHNDVPLYRCREFPHKWERHATLLSNIELGDATIVRRNGLYYLFGVTRDGGGGYSDTLSIYYADSLTGPWQPHANNPIMVDRANARPAGNFVELNGHLWRPVQDCSDGYGAALGLAEIVELTPESFTQVTRHRIKPSPAWPGRKLHTLNRLGRLEVIDGARIQPKVTSYFAKRSATAQPASGTGPPASSGIADSMP